MNTTRILSLSVLLLLQQGFAAQGADTWYANCANTGAQDGLTEATGFVKIQDAVDRAADGDTVIVLPGTYGDNQGTTDDYTYSTSVSRSRVVIGRNITLKSRDGAEATEIVGAWNGATSPVGPGAVRCLAITNTSGAVVQGFTFRDGATIDVGNYGPSYGGGVAGPFKSREALLRTLVVDCIFRNCCATRGGAMSYASAVRTLFVGNGVTGNYVLRNCNAFNCVFLFNGAWDADAGKLKATDKYNLAVVGDYYYVVNCTFAGNGGPAIAAASTGDPSEWKDRGCYNCIAFWNSSDGQSIKGNNPVTCVWDSLVDGTLNLDEDRHVYGIETPQPVVFDCVGGDFRPVSGTLAVNGGCVDHLAKIPAEFRDKDFHGAARQTGATVNMGAVEGSAVPAGGSLVVSAGSSMGAVRICGEHAKYQIAPFWENWILQAESWPSQVELGVTDGDDWTLFGWKQSGKWSETRFADAANRTRFTFPAADAVVTNALIRTKYVFYVDEKNGNDTGFDGTRSAQNKSGDKGPKKTLQAAVDAAETARSGNPAVIRVAAGVYGEGGFKNDQNGWMTRMTLTGNLLVRGAGPDVTVIKGQRDVTETGLKNNGCGPDAVRCVAMVSSDPSCVSGFTLLDGCVNNGADGDTAPFRGGGLYAAGACCQLIDCVVTNCAGSRGGALLKGWWQRCLVVGNHNETKNNTIYRAGCASSCIFRDNDNPNATYSSSMSGFYNCLFREVQNKPINDDSASTVYFNNVFVSAGASCKAVKSGVYGGNWTDGSAVTGWTKSSDLGLVAATEKDFRPKADSVLVTGGAVGSGEAANTFSRYVFEDFQGRPLRMVAGKPMAGPYQQEVYTLQAKGAVAGDIAPAGGVLVEPGQTVMFDSPNATTGVRQFIGYLKNGELVSEGSPCFAFTFPSGAYPIDPVEIRALYNTNWYVNAEEAYSDTNDGWTSETARHSLVAAVRDAVAGDVVHAAEGVYDSLAATNSSGHGARVVLDKAITLIADGAVERTVIKGAKATDGNQYGCGADALRCVSMSDSSRLVGFTLTEGRDHGVVETSDPNRGGGVWAKDLTPVIEDCIISNNVAIRFGGAYGGTFVRCRFLNNRAMHNGNAGGSGAYYGCLFDGNNGHQWMIDSQKQMIGCTITANNTFLNGSSGGVWKDTICLAATKACATNSVVSNCVFAANCDIWGKTAMGSDNVWLASGEQVIDSSGVPLVGGAAMDKGVVCPNLDGHAGGFDLFGTQRVYNGAQDIGAVERDWRGDYAARIGGGVTVTMASPEVEDSDRGVYLPSGGLTFVAPDSCGGKTYSTGIEVLGDGELVASLNGASAKSFQKGKGEYKACVSGGDELSFAYHAADADADGAYLSGFGRKGVMLILR